MKSQPIKADDDWYYASPWMMGYASCLPAEQADETVRRLHEVVAEVTGLPVEPPPRPRIGFLP